MVRSIKTKHIILAELIIFLALVSLNLFNYSNREAAIYVTSDSSGKDYIKWVNFDVSSKAMECAYKYDVESQEWEVKLDWIALLALLGNKYGGDFSRFKEKNMAEIVEKLKSKEETIESLTADMKYYEYYYEAYAAVLGGMVGTYKIEVADETAPGGKVWEERYGLKVFLPIAKFYPFSHFDDFGVSRSYGFRRKHLGHDMMGQVGTPIIAVESGYVEALGWNQYGGWRIGIRSFDKKRYYYYAHLRKNFPYRKDLAVGSIVQAGDVIGYLGRTGYSSNENANNIRTPHLHFGLQLIFDESQKESNNEIWVDCYDLIQFLYRNRCETSKNQETKEYTRVYQYIDPIAEYYIHHSIYRYDDDEFDIRIYD
ncbi:MAG: putative rane protein [Herbinix sp.]|jgi:murein DD-endopeptidase MepM/ murein hydrolase activator NlpD|nr:putative rane protein [Herbinix sp.]